MINKQKLDSILKIAHKSFVLKSIIVTYLQQAGDGKTLNQATSEVVVRYNLEKAGLLGRLTRNDWNRHISNYGIKESDSKLFKGKMARDYIVTRNPSGEKFISIPYDLAEKILVLGGLPGNFEYKS